MSAAQNGGVGSDINGSCPDYATGMLGAARRSRHSRRLSQAQTRRVLRENESGRTLLRQLAGDVAANEQAGERAINSLLRAAENDDPVRSEEAQRALGRLVLSASGYVEPPGSQAQVQHRRADLGRTVLKLVSRWPVSDATKRSLVAVAERWTWVGLFLSVAAGLLILNSQFLLAAAVVAVRVGTSLFFTTAGFPADEREDAAYRVASRACVGAHVADASILMAIAARLALSGQPLWSSLVVGCTVLMLSATLFRIAGFQEGIWIVRSPFERIYRVGSLVLGLAAASMVSSPVAEQGVPWVVFGAAGACGYAIYEILSSNREMTEYSRIRSSMGPDALMRDRFTVMVQVAARRSGAKFG